MIPEHSTESTLLISDMLLKLKLVMNLEAYLSTLGRRSVGEKGGFYYPLKKIGGPGMKTNQSAVLCVLRV